MKIENEVTGEIAEVIESYVGIRLHICGDITDFFAVDTEEKEIITRLNATTKILLKMEHTFEDYMQLIKDLGLEIPSKWKKHWTPTLKDGTLWCYFVNSVGEIEGNWLSNSTFNNKLVANFNLFPTRELAELGCNVSKISRLALLWQYANDCIFAPDLRQSKHHIMYGSMYKKMRVNVDCTVTQDKVYFETEEQAQAFIDMYETEIKKIMGVI